MPFLKLPNTNHLVCILITILLGSSCAKSQPLVMNGEKLNPIFIKEIDRETAEIIHHSYNWQFAKAMKEIDQLRKRSADPYVAETLAVGTAFWEYLAATTPEMNEKAKNQYNEVCDKAKDIAEKILKTDPDNIKAVALLGITEGSQSKFYALEAEWYKAYRYGVKGYSNLRKIERINPHDYDVQFGIGLYKYYCATYLPKWFQKLSWMVPGIDVDREGGYLRLQASSKFALLMKVEALLAFGQADSGYEQNYKAGIEMLEKLSNKHPNNMIFKYVLSVGYYYYGVHLRYTNQWEDSLKYLKKVQHVMPTKPTFRMLMKKKNYLTPNKRWILHAPYDYELNFVIYREIAKTLFYAGKFEQAQKQLEEGASKEYLPPNIRGALYFHAGLHCKLMKDSNADQYFKKAMEISTEGEEVYKYAKEMIGAELAEEDITLHEWHKKATAGKATIDDILKVIRLMPSEKYDYRYAYYEILYQLYKIKGDLKNSEKYNDLVRYHTQVER